MAVRSEIRTVPKCCAPDWQIRQSDVCESFVEPPFLWGIIDATGFAGAVRITLMPGKTGRTRLTISTTITLAAEQRNWSRALGAPYHVDSGAGNVKHNSQNRRAGIRPGAVGLRSRKQQMGIYRLSAGKEFESGSDGDRRWIDNYDELVERDLLSILGRDT